MICDKIGQPVAPGGARPSMYAVRLPNHALSFAAFAVFVSQFLTVNPQLSTNLGRQLHLHRFPPGRLQAGGRIWTRSLTGRSLGRGTGILPVNCVCVVWLAETHRQDARATTLLAHAGTVSSRTQGLWQTTPQDGGSGRL